MLKIMIVLVMLLGLSFTVYAEPKISNAKNEVKVGAETEGADEETEDAYDEEDYSTEDEAEPEIDEERENKEGEKQETSEKFIEGVIEEIAKDGSYVIINGQKIFTSKTYIEQEELTKGDRTVIYAEKTKDGWKISENTGDYNYPEEDEQEIDPSFDEGADDEDADAQDETDR